MPEALDQKWKEPLLAALREIPVLRHGCEVAGICRSQVLSVRKSDPEFDAAYEEAMQAGVDKAEKAAFHRATAGIEEPVIFQGKLQYRHTFEADENGQLQAKVLLDANGQPVPLTVARVSDQLLQFVLKGRRRETYGDKTEIGGIGGGAIQLDDTTRNARLAALLAAAQLRKELG